MRDITLESGGEGNCASGLIVIANTELLFSRLVAAKLLESACALPDNIIFADVIVAHPEPDLKVHIPDQILALFVPLWVFPRSVELLSSANHDVSDF